MRGSLTLDGAVLMMCLKVGAGLIAAWLKRVERRVCVVRWIVTMYVDYVDSSVAVDVSSPWRMRVEFVVR
mgnify:CR=1 FL=1